MPLHLPDATIAVTGASGFLGRYFVRALLARGARVVAVVRNPAKVPQLAAGGCRVAAADLGDVTALTRAFSGCDAVLSNAGLIALGRERPDEVIATNVQGTRNVFAALADAGVGRVVLTSSAAAYAWRADHTYREDHPLRSPSDRLHRFSAYPISKAMGEREAWDLASRHGIALTTIRPQAIHGAFDEHGATWWLRRMTGGPVGVWLAGLRFPSVYAGDLAEAVMRILERDVSVGKAYNLAGDPGVHTFWDLLRALRAAGATPARVVVPLPAPFTRRFVLDAARADLDFSNRPLVDGLRETLQLEALQAL